MEQKKRAPEYKESHAPCESGGAEPMTGAQASHLKTLADEIGSWLALGGGGYALDVVPRAWTLAYGLMSEQHFRDELPSEYGAQYGYGQLHDTYLPKLEQWRLEQTQTNAARVIAAVEAQTQGIWQIGS